MESVAHEWSPPAATEVAFVRPLTSTGMLEWVVDPLPSFPSVLCPQHFTSPDVRVLQVCRSPAAIVVALVIPVTATGVLELTSVPLPSCPYGFSPQQRTVPVASTAQV